jgi:DNA-binding LacI/PurR family transcriptional regulator
VLLTEQLSYAFSDPYAIEFLAGLSEVVEQERISIVLMPLSLDREEPDTTAVRQANIDALTSVGLPPTHPAMVVARARGIRLVGSDSNPDPDSAWVAIDDRVGGRLIGEHLAALGHRNVAVVIETNRPAGNAAIELSAGDVVYLTYAERLRVLQEAFRGKLLLVSAGHNAVASGRAAAGWLLSRDNPPTAIAALSDVLALGVLEAVAACGLSVPGDISVCGFDDIVAAAEVGLTTVRQPIRERGRRVGELLLDSDRPDRQVLLPIELIVRTSTGPALNRAGRGSRHRPAAGPESSA